MKNVPVKWLLLLAFFFFVSGVYGQTEELPPIDESQFNDQNTSAVPAPETNINSEAPSTSTQTTKPIPDLGPEPNFDAPASDDANTEKNAIIEGVQVSSEPGDKPDEKTVTCYFIFQDKPSSYFYEVKLKEKKIIFEFNDTKKSDAPINFTAEPPMTNFTVEQKLININKEIKGLLSEYHNQVRVTFNVTAVPKIQVSDEFSVISFTYKWSTNPVKQKDLIVTNPGPKVMIWSAASVATIGAGALCYFLFFGPPPPPPLGPLDISDLPPRPNQN